MYDFLERLGIKPVNSGACAKGWIPAPTGGKLVSFNPTTGEPIASIMMASRADYETVAQAAQETFLRFRTMPAPARGELVRRIGDALRTHKEDLGSVVALEMGKILPEGLGEVQEMIDICDFAVGLSRQLYGLTMPSERPGHRMMEQWHPLGIVGIISAFNFPVAVWSWNAMLGAVCGDSMIWKPSSKTPLCAVAVQNIINPILKEFDLEGLMGLVIGRGKDVGDVLVNDPRVPLISFTGSGHQGMKVGQAVSARLGRHILELGGNNAIIVMDDADLDLATRAILFGAVVTAGQRCTSTRRILMHANIAQELTRRLLKAYAQIPIGDPMQPGTLMGPLIDQDAVTFMMAAMEDVKAQGGEILCGGTAIEEGPLANGSFVLPTLVKAHKDMAIVQEETFAPVLYLITIQDFQEAIEVHNNVRQGLSSAIFTRNALHAEQFLSAAGSDCGTANVNIGTSGAEIGGAFGGEKETGGGRESGSDSWKAYMRRQTNTINYSTALPLAQGIKFEY